MNVNAATEPIQLAGRYVLHGELAAGGMASVHLGRLVGSVGFSRPVAIKRLHAQYARDPQFVAMFVDEARLAARVRHPNVVPTLDVVATDDEVFIVMEYVHGEALSRILRTLGQRAERLPHDIVAAIILGVLEGLHAAHEAKDERGVAMNIVHRDVSPQNILVGADGVARVFDFGIAKAIGRMQTTEDGSIKGKMAYMSPEQLSNREVDRRTDVWAASVVLWEMLAGKRLFVADSAAGLVNVVMTTEPQRLNAICMCPAGLDAVVARGLSKDPAKRFPTTREMAIAIEKEQAPASPRAVSEWLDKAAGDELNAKAIRVEEMESDAGPHRPSKGTVRTKLAALGFTTRGDAFESTHPVLAAPLGSEEPTRGAPGRVAKAPVSAPRLDASPALREVEASPPKPRSRVPWRLALPIVAIVAAAVAVVFLVRTPTPPPPVSSHTEEPLVPSAAAPLASPSTPAAQVPVESEGTEAPPTTGTHEPSAPPEGRLPTPSRRVPGAGRPSATHRGVGKTADAAPPKLNCDPPYTIGPAPDFIKRPKLECLPQ